MALVNNPIELIVDKNISINSSIEISLIDLSYYAEKNIPGYDVITEIPKEHMDYINSVKYANNCEGMFYNCRKLISIDLSKFNTSKVINMLVMFSGCESLSTLDLSNFNTSNVITIKGMFMNCASLITIKGTLDLSSCKLVSYMFENCPVKGLHLKNVPRSLIDPFDGSLVNAGGTLNKTYIIDNILEDR